VCYLDHCNSKE